MTHSNSTITNALTIDLEDWHQLAYRKLLDCHISPSPHVLTCTYTILEVLAKFNTQATFFVLAPVALKYPQLIKEIKQAGHEIASHGYGHRKVSELSPEAFAQDLRQSIDILQEIIQKPILGYRAPEFSINHHTDWAYEVMIGLGLKYDSSIFPIRHPRYGEPQAHRHPYQVVTKSGSITEFPLATYKILGQNIPIAGGGYLRTIPLPLIKHGIRRLNQQNKSAIIYLHPYECSKEKLDVPVKAKSFSHNLHLKMRYWKRNIGKGDAMKFKLEQLLESFEFAPLQHMYSHPNYANDINEKQFVLSKKST